MILRNLYELRPRPISSLLESGTLYTLVGISILTMGVGFLALPLPKQKTQTLRPYISPSKRFPALSCPDEKKSGSYLQESSNLSHILRPAMSTTAVVDSLTNNGNNFYLPSETGR